ncbi:MAG: diphthine--ammonia ligase [Nanoarchaeota archaeon]
MKCAVLFSGGKDSCLALHKAKKEGHEICYLLTIIPDNFDSFMFHKPYLSLLKKQAEMLGLKDKLIIVKSQGEKEKELKDLKLLMNKVKDKVKAIVVGGIASNYQGDRIKKICDEFNLKLIAPLLNYKSEDVWKELFNEGFEIILTKIACDGLDDSWIGKIIDKKKFEELKKLSEKYKFRIDFEGGEAESAVLFMPEFKKEIKIKFNIKSEGRYRHWIDELKIIN